jgi:death-on-curing protein
LALLAAANREHYEGASLATCAATYAFHLTRSHPFVDGNKRVGAAVSEIFVQLNGAHLSATNDEIVALFLGIADGSVSREEVERLFAAWVEQP